MGPEYLHIKGPWAQGPGLMDSRAHGLMGPWAHGLMDPWAQGPMSPWALHHRLFIWALYMEVLWPYYPLVVPVSLGVVLLCLGCVVY